MRVLIMLATVALLGGCGGEAASDPPADADHAQTSQNGAAAEAAAPKADIFTVRLDTEAGAITLALDSKHAPVTTANFLRYVDEKRLDGTYFYRAAPTPGTHGRGLIQGGTHRVYARMLPGIEHEPTSRTGLRHVDGTISMARLAPGTATGDFFITVGAMPSMDSPAGGKGDDVGYAAFGHVTRGMDVVRHILAAPTLANAGRGAMRGQMIAKPVKIVSARREP
jgi:peptidyl-prolyl cis-trans isomerase A (cyclophilin A)